MRPPFLSCGFHTLWVSWAQRGERGVCLIKHQVTPKSVFFKEVAVPLLEAIQHLEKDGSNLHSLNAPQMSREIFPLHQL